jgi:general secretion pathway protein L
MDFLIVEVNRHAITATRFRGKGKALTFAGAVTRPLENEESLGLLLQEHASGEDGKEKVILSLDSASIYSREMELPIRDRNKLREILPLELKGETAVDTDELIFDTVPLQGQKLLAIWAKLADIAQLIATMLKAGLEPQVVTSAPFHWQTLLPDTADGFIAISDGTALAVYHDREPVYIRSLGEGEPAREIEKLWRLLKSAKKSRSDRFFSSEVLPRRERLLLPGRKVQNPPLPGSPLPVNWPRHSLIIPLWPSNMPAPGLWHVKIFLEA